MTTPVQNLTFHEGRNWRIVFTAHDEDNAVLPLVSGVNIQCRISSTIDGVTETSMTLNIGSGITIFDPALGIADIVITTEEQTEHNITSAGMHFYEILVEVEEYSGVQVEGRLTVEPSLFGTAAMNPLVIDFKTRFPEFTEDDNLIAVFIGDAGRIVDDANFKTEDIPVAKVYLAAHLLMMRKIAARQYQEGGVQVGSLRSISVEDRTLSFNNPTSGQQQSRSGFAQTAYGQEYLSMLRRNPVFLLRA